jgi:long-chain fatty acid transport protein
MSNKTATKTVNCVLFLFLFFGQSFAGGYALPDLTAKAIGQATAVTAGIDDPSAVYFNPAALREIEGNQLMGGVNYINTQSSVSNNGEQSNNRSDHALTLDAFANFHVPATNLSLGFGVYTPFGLATEYGERSFTRYGAIRSELKTFYVTPSIAWQVHPLISVGGGLSFVRGSATLSRAIFISPLLPDAKLRIKGTDESFAFNLGALFKPHESLKFGLVFKSRAFLEFEGANVKFKDPLDSTMRTEIASGATVPLPTVVSAGVHWQATPAWDLEFVYDWTKWNDFKSLKAKFKTPLLVLGVPSIPGLFVDQSWKNTSTLRFGTSFRVKDNLRLRGGIALDETPIPSRTLSPAIPGADLLTLNAGISYTWKAFAIDLGYMAVINKIRRVTNGVLEGNPALTPGSDKYKTYGHFVAINLRYKL